MNPERTTTTTQVESTTTQVESTTTQVESTTTQVESTTTQVESTTAGSGSESITCVELVTYLALLITVVQPFRR